MTPTNYTPAQAPDLSPYHAAILKCVERYKSLDFEDAKLRTFLDEIEEGCRSSLPIQKLNRWLGYVQGVLISRGLTSVAVERDWTRPLFRPLDFPAPSANAAQVTDAEYADVCQSYIDMVRTPVDAPSLTRPSEQAVTEAWRPIETAPKDGTPFQAWIEKYGWEPRARFNPDSEAFELWGRVDYDKDGWDVYSHMVPTHWMPLPAAPESPDA